MTDWTVVLADGTTTTVAADEMTTRQDGSLWLLAELDPPLTKLTPVLVLARGRWHACHPAAVSPLPEPAPPPTPRTA
jgi:hypothetical protein